jgi:hypothetical protein
MQSDPRQRLLEFLQQHDDRARISIIAAIMHNLTVAGRAFGLDLSGDAFRKGMLGLNEIQHSLSGSLLALQGSREFSCEFCAGAVFDGAQSHGILGQVKWAVSTALDRRAQKAPVV